MALLEAPSPKSQNQLVGSRRTAVSNAGRETSRSVRSSTSALAVIRRETGSWKWMWVTFGYMLVLAYIAAFATYHVAVALGAG